MGEVSKVCSEFVPKCFYRIGRLDILWSVNKLARSITKWTEACDKRLNRLISYIHHTCETNNIAMWETLPNNADWDCFKTPILQEIWRIQNLHQVEHCAFLEVICVPISSMRKKQTSVSHSSTESEIISMDAGLRLDGILALDLWDLIVTVLHGNTNQRKQVQGDLSTSLSRKKIPGRVGYLNGVDCVPSNANSCRQEAML